MGLWMGIAPSHLALLSPLSRSRRLWDGATLTSERPVPLSQGGRPLRYRPKPPAQLIRATRSRKVRKSHIPIASSVSILLNRIFIFNYEIVICEKPSVAVEDRAR